MKWPHSSRAFGGSWPLVILLVCLPAAALALPANVRLVSSGPASVSFEVAVPAPRIVTGAAGEVRVLLEGYGTFSPPGAVELPGSTFRVAIPAEGQARFSVSVGEEQPLGSINLVRVAGERVVRVENGMPITEKYLPPDPWQEGYCPPLVVADDPCFMGRQRVLPLRVNPLQIDRNGARLVRKLTITVTFERPAVSGAAIAPAAPVSSTWQRLYDGLLVNPASVAAFRKPLAPTSAPVRSAEAGKRLKILVPETGLYALRADSLIAAGLSPGLSTGEIALRYYYYDETQPSLARAVEVPALFIESAGGAPGVFDGSDLLVFYALGIKDDADALDLDARYTDNDVIWLEEQVAGAAMTASPIAITTPANPLPTFQATLKHRKDTYFNKTSPAGTTDFYFAEAPPVMQTSFPFELLSPAGRGAYTITVRVLGNDHLGLTHTISFSLKNANGTFKLSSGLYFTAEEARTFVLQDTTSGRLADGANELVVQCNSDYAYMINDFTVTYPARFVAHGNMIDFTLPAGADYWTPVITGFTVNHAYLIEVTNPRVPVCQELTPAFFTADGSGYKLTLSFEASAERHYIILGAGAGTGIAVRSISVDTPSRLRGTAGSYNVMAIVHSDFAQRFGEYLDRRRSQGWRIITADVQDVCDEFNGGRHSPYAVKRFIKYGFDHWGIEFVILVGDGQMDAKQVMKGMPPAQRGSPPDYIPVYTYSMNVSGLYNDEVTASDKWYAFLDETLPVDATPQGVTAASPGASGAPSAHAYPDVFIGRLSVGRDVELRAVLNKIVRFETTAAGDSWRRRIVLFADDAWSGRGTEDPYRYKSYEGQFEWSTDTCGAIVEQALPGGFDVRRVFMSHWTTGAHPNGDEVGPTVYEASVDTTRRYYTPYLLKELNKGCLFFMFQGHASRSVMTHEQALASFLQYNDIDSLKTFLPNVFIGVGCHISDFAPSEEYSLDMLDGPDGDCFSEQMLFKPGGGSAITYASTGFEYLSQNSELVETVFRTLFKTPPSDSVEPGNAYTGAHWIFSEAMTEGEIAEIDQSTFGLDMALRYTILGDPLLRVDPGPPLMRLEADWGKGYQPVAPDSFHARNGANHVRLSFRVSDVVAVGKVSLQVNGADWTDSLAVTPLLDAGKTYSRSYRADLDYTVDPKDGQLVYRVSTPEGVEAGVVEVPIVTTIACSVDGLQLLPGVESPPSGTFAVTVDFPSYLAQPPVLAIDGLVQEDVRFTVPDPQDSLRWRAVFTRTLSSGQRVFTVKTGDFSKDFTFSVTGSELAATAFTFPNPFQHNTNIIYTLNLPADKGRIEIYTVSGILIRKIDLPVSELGAASYVSPHSIVWDGRDVAGDRVANGTYIYLLFLDKGRRDIEIKGKMVKLE